MSKPILWIVIPCYNEEQVLPITAPLFLKKINDLSAAGLISEKSRVLFVNATPPGPSSRSLPLRMSTSSASPRAGTEATRTPCWPG